MRNLLIVALSVVVMLSGCAGYTSRTFQIKQPQVDDSAAKTEPTIRFQRAAEIAREVLESYKYTITYFKCKSNRYACVRAKKYDEIGWILPHLFRYRTEIRIRGKDLSHQYEVSSYRKYVPWLDLNPFDYFRPYHRNEKEEQKILDEIERRYNRPS